MNRCLKMIITMDKWESSWNNDIQKQAKKFEIEGLMQLVGDNQLRIVVCGKSEKLDDFIDYLYDFFLTINARVEELEPFIKERDYRGIFRII